MYQKIHMWSMFVYISKEKKELIVWALRISSLCASSHLICGVDELNQVEGLTAAKTHIFYELKGIAQ